MGVTSGPLAVPFFPQADPLPLPAPPALLIFLSLLTLTLHLLAMNCLLGGTVLAGIAYAKERKGSAGWARLGAFLRFALPPAVAATVTLGVAPLLFLQVLYGQVFYTSSILVAWPWLAVVAIVLVVYYGHYIIQYRREKLGRRATIAAWLIAAMMTFVGFTYVQNMVLMLRPDAWRSLYNHSTVGLALYGGDPQILPRFLHMLTAALAVSGLFVGLWGFAKRKSDQALGAWAMKLGGRVFAAFTALQAAVGIWFLGSLRSPVTKALTGHDGLWTFVLGLGIGAAVLALVSALLSPSRPRLMPAAAVLTLAAVGAMVSVRHFVRTQYLASYVDLQAAAVKGQWPVFVVFAALLLAGLGAIGWMLVKVARPAGGELSAS